METKTCIKCGVHLTKDNFSWYRAKNYIWKCDACVRWEKAKQAKDKYRKNPEKQKTIAKTYLNRLKTADPVRYTCKTMASSAKKRAKSLGLIADVDTNYLVSIAPKTCPVFGWELKYGGGEKAKNSPSLDRIDSTKGYTRDNVQVISLLANLMKNEATQPELEIFAKWVLQK